MKNLISKLKNAVVSGALGLALVCTPKIVSAGDISGYFETSVATNYSSTSSGGVFARKNPEEKRAVNQNFVSVSKPIGKGEVSLGAWSSYDSKDKELHEYDLCLSYSHPITENISGSIAFEQWNYPSELFGEKPDYVIHGTVGVDLPKDVKLKLEEYYLITDSEFYGGMAFVVHASKNFPLAKKGGYDLSGTIGVKSSYMKDYYGQDGIPHITPGAGLDISKGKWNISIKGNYQKGLKKNVKTYGYGSVSLGRSF